MIVFFFIALYLFIYWFKVISFLSSYLELSFSVPKDGADW